VIWLVAAALLQAAPVAAGDEIVVMGRRLQSLSVMLSRDARGKFACELSESSGSPSVDAQLCKSAARCAKQGKVAADAMRSCIEARKPAILEEFAAHVRSGKG
jgi:hypothetical protein